MDSDWLTENVNKFADWSKTKFPLVMIRHPTSIALVVEMCSFAFVTTKSIKVTEVLVSLVGLLINWSSWQREHKKLNRCVWKPGEAFIRSQLVSPIIITFLFSDTYFWRNASQSSNKFRFEFGGLYHVNQGGPLPKIFFSFAFNYTKIYFFHITK